RTAMPSARPPGSSRRSAGGGSLRPSGFSAARPARLAMGECPICTGPADHERHPLACWKRLTARLMTRESLALELAFLERLTTLLTDGPFEQAPDGGLVWRELS